MIALPQDSNSLTDLYRQRARVLALVAAIYYAALALAHAFLVPPPAQGWMITLALTTALAGAGLKAWLSRAPGPYAQVEAAAAAIFTLATLNVTVHAILLQSADQATFLPIMAIGFALLSPSRRVLAYTLACQAAAAIAICTAVAPAPGVTFVFVIVSALCGAWFGGLFTLRTAEQLLARKEQAETLSRELEARVESRTAALNEAMQAATAANAAKSQFLAVMSHELRTPLNAIIGYSEIMRETAEEQARTQDQADLSRVLSAAHRLLHMINGVLDLSKIEAGRLDLSLGKVDIASLVREAADAVRPAAEASGVALAVHAEPGLGAAYTDGFRLSQCLLNLMSNAVKFSPGGAVSLTAAREEGALVFCVKDTGIGIAADQIERLFQPFTQADGSTTRQFGGTGLGLAITREIAHLLGGDVTVESVLGEGSTFTLRVAAQVTPLQAVAA